MNSIIEISPPLAATNLNNASGPLISGGGGGRGASKEYDKDKKSGAGRDKDSFQGGKAPSRRPACMERARCKHEACTEPGRSVHKVVLAKYIFKLVFISEIFICNF